MEGDDVAYPCKGCGDVCLFERQNLSSPALTLAQILEEGKAFELGE